MVTDQERFQALSIAVKALSIVLDKTFPGTLQNIQNAVQWDTLSPGTQIALRDLLNGK